MALFENILVLVRGGGDIASGAIYRLHQAGFPVVVSELDAPQFVRRAVCYGEAVYSNRITIDGVTAQLAESINVCYDILEQGNIPVVRDPTKVIIETLKPIVLIDGRMQKRNTDTLIDDAPLVIALGPGYTAGIDCHVIIETNRGHNLGRVITNGMAEPDTGEPATVKGETHSRVLRAPSDGYVKSLAEIGDLININQPIANVDGTPIVARFTGVLRGLVHPNVHAKKGMKIGDLDPRSKRENCFTISDKSLAVGGGVLEAVLATERIQRYFQDRQIEDETTSGI